MTEQIKVKVLDKICGAGKTTWIFNQMKNNPDKKYIFVSPYLDETGDGNTKGRIQRELPELNFESPSAQPTKKASFLRNVEKGKNIAITHKLFTQFTPDVANAIEEQGYELIIDETIDLVNFYEDVKGDDVKLLIRAGMVKVEDKGKLIWNHTECPDYKGRDADIMNLCDLGCLYLYGDNVLIQRIPPTCMQACRSVTILTYMFEGSLMSAWMKLNNIEHSFIHPEELRSTKEIKQIVRDKLRIVKLPRGIQEIQYENGYLIQSTFCKSWYERTSVPVFNDIKKSIETVLKETMLKGTVFWTTFKDYQTTLQGIGYTRSKKVPWMKELRSPFVPKNMRASNEYRDCTNCIYTVNVYPHGSIESHLKSFGVEIDRDKYALSELIQFMFRGCIREHKDMDILILSIRMKRLLEDWLLTDE